MPGVPEFISDGPWWWVYLYLWCVVFFRTQGTYWLGWWLRRGAEGSSADATEPGTHPDASTNANATGFRARMHRRFSGASWQKAQRVIERWGFIAIPLSFLTIGFQTMVNAAAGFLRMRWDLYTFAMIPGCFMWAAVWTGVALGLAQAWQHSPWTFAAALVLIALAGALTVVRRRTRPSVATS